MWAKRLGAIVLAVGLIAGGLLVRRGLDDDRGGGSGDGGGGSRSTTVVCIPELQTACRALAAEDGDLDLTIEDAGETYERVAADPGTAPEVWITLGPWPDMARSAATLAGGEDPFPNGGQSAASSGLVMVGRSPRMTVLEDHCGGTTTWHCIGDSAGDPWSGLGGDQSWGVLKPSHADAARSAAGLLSFAAIVTDYQGSADYTGTDLENDDAFLSWLNRLESAIPTYGDGLNTPLSILLAQPRIDVVGTTQAEIDERAGAQAGDLSVHPPAGPTAPLAEVVVAGGPKAQDIWESSTFRDALTASGWSAPPTGSPELPAGTGLPPADVMIALRDLWQGVARR